MSCIVIHSHVLRSQAAQLRVGCGCGHVPGHGESALKLLGIAWATIARVDPSHPLKPLSRGLLHPMYTVAGDGKPRKTTGDFH